MEISFTGLTAADGLSVKNPADLAVEKIYKDGNLLGNAIGLVANNDRVYAKEAAALAKKLIQQIWVFKSLTTLSIMEFYKIMFQK